MRRRRSAISLKPRAVLGNEWEEIYRPFADLVARYDDQDMQHDTPFDTAPTQLSIAPPHLFAAILKLRVPRNRQAPPLQLPLDNLPPPDLLLPIDGSKPPVEQPDVRQRRQPVIGRENLGEFLRFRRGSEVVEEHLDGVGLLDNRVGDARAGQLGDAFDYLEIWLIGSFGVSGLGHVRRI